jgi:hypothetical protein
MLRSGSKLVGGSSKVSPRPCKRQNSIWLRFDHSTAQNVTLTPKILELPSYHLNSVAQGSSPRSTSHKSNLRRGEGKLISSSCCSLTGKSLSALPSRGVELPHVSAACNPQSMATARIQGGVARASFSAEFNCHCSRSLGNNHDSGHPDYGNGFSSQQSGRFLHVHSLPSAFFAGELRLSGGSSFWEELGFGWRSRNRICRQSRPVSAFPPLQPSLSSPDRGPAVPWSRNGSSGAIPDSMMHNEVDNQKRKEPRSCINSIISSGTWSSRSWVRCQVAAIDASPEHITETSHASKERRRVDSLSLGHRTFRRRRVVCRVAAKEAPPPVSRQSIPPVEEEVPARCEKAPELSKYSAPAFPRRLPSQLQVRCSYFWVTL